MRVSTLNAWEQVSCLAGWDELVEESGASPVSTRSYVIPWWREQGKGRLCCVIAEEGDRLVGLLLAYEQPLFPGRWEVRCLGHGPGAVHRVLAPPHRTDVVEALWDGLLGDSRRQLHMHGLEDVPSSTPSGAFAERARTIAARPLTELDLDGPGDAADPIEPIETVSSIDIVRASTPDAVPRLWPEFIGHPDDDPTGGSGPSATSFALSMLDATARRGGLSIHAARSGSDLIAVSIGLHTGSVAAVWGPLVHRRLDGVPAPHAVDRLLLDDVVAEARRRGAHRLILDGDRGPGWRPLRLIGVTTVVPPQVPERVARWLHR